jgi:hypothetical protein
VPVHALPISAPEDRPLDPFPDREIDGPRGPGRERDRDDFPALAQHRQRPMLALDAQRLGVRAECFRDPQPVQRPQRDQRVLGRCPQSGRDQ